MVDACNSSSAAPELLGESEQDAFRAADIAEPIHVRIVDHVADEFHAVRVNFFPSFAETS